MFLPHGTTQLVCSMLSRPKDDEKLKSSFAAPADITRTPTKSPPRSPLAVEHRGMHIHIPVSNFDACSPQHIAALEHLPPDLRCNTPPRYTSSSPQESQASHSPVSPPLSRAPPTPSSPSRSPFRRLLPAIARSNVLPELKQASLYAVHAITSPARRQSVYATCGTALHILSIICIIWFAISWLRTYSFEIARIELMTVLRYMLLVTAPLTLWCLPALCALSALLTWPRMSYLNPAEASAHLHLRSEASSPISFPPVPRRSCCFDREPSSDTYAIAAAAEDLFHDAATPRFGFSISTDPHHPSDDGAASPYAPPRSASPPLQLTPKSFADACIHGATLVTSSCTGRTASDLRRPLLPAPSKPHHTSTPRVGCSGGCLTRTSSILFVWLRHELYLAVLCAVAGYGTFAVALFDRDVLTRVAGAVIVMYSTPTLQHMAVSGSVILFGLYSILLASGCLCALLSLWCSTIIHRHRSRTATHIN